MKEFNAKLQEKTEAIERENNLKITLKEKEYADKAKDDLSKKETEIIELKSKLENAESKYKSEAELESIKQKQKIEAEFREELKQKEAEIKDEW